jgi:predicted DNA-binding transcriptional regulator AlpA
MAHQAIESVQFTARFIDFSELSRITTLKKTALYELIKIGEFRPIKLGRKTVFAESEVAAWVNARLASRG